MRFSSGKFVFSVKHPIMFVSVDNARYYRSKILAGWLETALNGFGISLRRRYCIIDLFPNYRRLLYRKMKEENDNREGAKKVMSD
jgi:hypothetical protein